MSCGVGTIHLHTDTVILINHILSPLSLSSLNFSKGVLYSVCEEDSKLLAFLIVDVCRFVATRVWQRRLKQGHKDFYNAVSHRLLHNEPAITCGRCSVL